MSIRYVSFSDLSETGRGFFTSAFQCWFTTDYQEGQSHVG